MQTPIDNDRDVIDAVNYLLSGPSSLGQNFEGVSAVGLPTLLVDDQFIPEAQTYFTSLNLIPYAHDRYLDYLAPFSAGFSPNYPAWATLPGGLAITNIVPVTATGDLIDITYTQGLVTNETQSPFAVGQIIELAGNNPAGYDGTYVVTDCGETDSTVLPTTITIKALAGIQTWPVFVAGGTVSINDYAWQDAVNSQNYNLGLQAVVGTTGATDRVFISAQADIGMLTYTMFDLIVPYQPLMYWQINRYKAIKTTTLPNDILPYDSFNNVNRYYQGYEWAYDDTLIEVPFVIQWDALGTQIYETTVAISVINIIDDPGLGYYWYALEIKAYPQRDPAPNTGCILPVGARTYGLRSFTAQVIKR